MLAGGASFVKQLGVSTSTHKVDGVALDLIDQQEVTANMAFPVIGPIALERVIEPFLAERGIVRDQQQHRLLETDHVVAA